MTKFKLSEDQKKWFKAALIRAVKTSIQILLTYVTLGMTLKDVKWDEAISAMIIGFGYSLLTNIVKKPPEAKEPDMDGDIIFTEPDENGLEANEKLIFNLTTDLEEIKDKDYIVMRSVSSKKDNTGEPPEILP